MLIPFACWIAEKTDAIDYPSDRRVNKQAIPRTGGIAVFGGMSIALILMVILVKMNIISTPFIEHPYLEVNWTIAGIGVAIMFIVGLIDDIYDLPPIVKLIGQIISACVIAMSGILLSTIGDPTGHATISLGWLAYPITVVYLVAFANIINLIDGLDGLSSSITIIATITIMVFAAIHMRVEVLMFGFILIGSCLAFLRYNWNPASIFIGDSGALVLGELLGILSIIAIARSTLFTALLVPILAAGVPILDTLLAIIRRKLSHKSIMEADKGHIHHRLLESGRSQKQTVIIMIVWTILLSSCGIAVTLLRGIPRYVVFIVAAVISIIIIWKLGVLKPVLAHTYTHRISKRNISNGTYSLEDYEKAKDFKEDDTEIMIEEEKEERHSDD